MRSLGWITCLLFLFPAFLFGDADRQDWLGEYAINHDGHPGTLRITQAKCRPGLPCVGLRVQYVDEHGATVGSTVSALDDNGQHMRFTIDFPGNPQVFDVYIFSFDKNKLAGTTVWGGRTFGVMASKTAARPMLMGTIATAVPKPVLTGIQAIPATPKSGGGTSWSGGTAGSPTRTLLADGSIELTYPDGTVKTKRVGSCGWNTRYPDGHTDLAKCAEMQTMPLVPPPPPAGSKEEHWLEAQDSNLLEIIQTILGGADSESYQNYLQNYENPPNPVLYKRIFYRTLALAELTSTPH